MSPMKIYPKWFYQNKEVIAPEIGHRHFKLKVGNVWIKLFRMRNINELKEKLVFFAPESAYISVSTFADPKHVGMKYNMQGRAGFKVHQNIILRTDFVIDIDDEWRPTKTDEKGRRLPKEKINPVNEFAKIVFTLESEFNDLLFVVTKRGFHVWVRDFYDKRCRGKGALRPHEREHFLLSEKRRLANQLLSSGCKFDYDVTVDTRRVVRLIGSLHNDGITVCSMFTNKEDAIGCYVQRHRWDDKGFSGGAEKMTRNVYEGEDVIKGSSGERTPDLSNSSVGQSRHSPIISKEEVEASI